MRFERDTSRMALAILSNLLILVVYSYCLPCHKWLKILNAVSFSFRLVTTQRGSPSVASDFREASHQGQNQRGDGVERIQLSMNSSGNLEKKNFVCL